MPKDLYLGEVSGVAVNSKGHIFVFSRGNMTGPAYAAAAAQLLEFDENGRYVREIGHNLYAWSFAHAVRVDAHDNIWVTDKGSDLIVRFDPDGQVTMVLGRKQEASDEDTGPLKHPKPPLPAENGRFRQVTDVAWDAAGNTYISDGYINARVAKVDRNGQWVKSWGGPGSDPGQLNTPHSIATDNAGNVYVADRGNRRIQVFDGDGKLLRIMQIDVPFDHSVVPVIGNPLDPDAKAGTFSPGAPWTRVHHARSEPGAVRIGRVSGPHLQDDARREDPRHHRRRRTAAEAVRLGPRDRLSVRGHAVRRRAVELARAEADPASGEVIDGERSMRTRSGFAFPVVVAAFAAAIAIAGCSLRGSSAAGPITVVPTAKTVDRLYVLYCGEAKIPDISPWSPGVDVGKPFEFSDNCYLIRHGDDWMMWDTGFPDALALVPDGALGARNMRMYRRKTLASQMAELGVRPEQVDVLAFSHTHGDHVGNGNLFVGATLYIQEAEYDAAFGAEPQKFGFAPATYDRLRTSKIVKLNGDYDVFGDGSVTILSTPGHTPGHQSLLVRLPKTGPVVLSGDVAHFRSNFDNRRVPGFNFDVEQSKQSIDKLAAVVRVEHAQLWINHDAEQNATIPHAPAFVE